MSTIARFWDDAIVPALVEYIRIPAKSPHFDPGWARTATSSARSSSPPAGAGATR